MRKTILAFAVACILTPLAALATGKNYEVKISGMHCAGCVQAIKGALNKMPDVEPGTVKVTLKENRATLAVKDGAAVDKAAIQAAIEKFGDYKVVDVQPL